MLHLSYFSGLTVHRSPHRQCLLSCSDGMIPAENEAWYKGMIVNGKRITVNKSVTLWVERV